MQSTAGKASGAKLRGNLLALLGSHLPHLAAILLTGGPGAAAQALQLIVGDSEKDCSLTAESNTQTKPPTLVDLAAKVAFWRANGVRPI